MGGRRERMDGEREGREKGREGKGGGACSNVLGGIDAPGGEVRVSCLGGGA